MIYFVITLFFSLLCAALAWRHAYGKGHEEGYEAGFSHARRQCVPKPPSADPGIYRKCQPQEKP